MKMLLLLVCFQALNLVIIFYQGKKLTSPNTYLIFLFGAIFLHMLFKLGLSWISTDPLLFEKLHAGFSYLYGPMLWFYVKSIQQKELGPRHTLVHLLPFFGTMLFNFVLLIMLALSQEIRLLLIGIESYFLGGICLSVLTYCIRSIIYLVQSKSLPKFEMLMASWLIFIFTLFSMIIGGYLFFGKISFLPISARSVAYGLFLGMFIGVLVLKSLMAWKNSLSLGVEALNSKKPELPKYKNYQLENFDLDQLCIQILDHLNRDKPFKNPDYSLEEMAKQLGLPKIKLTQALNLKLGKNFYQLINGARAEEAKLLLEKGGSADLIGIGIESGFKSKSTFYKYFKEAHGLSPGDYKRDKRVIKTS